MTEMKPRSRWRRYAARAFGLGMAALAVWLVVRDQDARDALSQVDGVTLALVFLLQAINIVTDSIRYLMAIPGRYRSGIHRWAWHYIFTVGRIMNGVAPPSGTAYRAGHLRVVFGVPVGAYFGSVLAISWLGNGVALTVMGVVVLLVGSAGMGAIVLFIGLAILFLVGVAPRFRLLTGRSTFRMPERVVSALREMGSAFAEMARTPRHLARVLVVSVVTQISGAIAYVLACHALGIDSPLEVGVIIYAATSVATVVPLIPGGLGVAELTAAAVGELIDIGAGLGVLAALVIRVTGFLAVSMLAIAAVLGGGAKAAFKSPSDG
jgi:uncharacterized protein (TIRG00374 family)